MKKKYLYFWAIGGWRSNPDMYNEASDGMFDAVEHVHGLRELELAETSEPDDLIVRTDGKVLLDSVGYLLANRLQDVPGVWMEARYE